MIMSQGKAQRTDTSSTKAGSNTLVREAPASLRKSVVAPFCSPGLMAGEVIIQLGYLIAVEKMGP